MYYCKNGFMHSKMGPFERGGMGNHHYGNRPYGHEGPGFRKGAQTYRRGRVISFLDRLLLRKETLQNQLNQEEFKDIKPVLSGELKALELVINELIQEFELELDDSDEPAKPDVKSEEQILAQGD